MEVVYTLEGRPFRTDDDRIWNRDGLYIGKQVDGLFYSPSGAYIGEFRGERLGFNHRHAHKNKAAHRPRRNRRAIVRRDRMARTIPSGWDEFRG